MANLYISDAKGSLEQYFVGDPVTQANQVISDSLHKSLNFALGQVPTNAVGSLSVTNTQISYVLSPGSAAPAGVKIIMTGSGFPTGATTLTSLSADTDYSITSVKVIIDSIPSTNFLSPVSTVTLNTNISVAATRMTSFGLTGFTIEAGDVKVDLSGTLTTTLGADASGSVVLNTATFSNAALSITYDTDPSSTSTKLAQLFLKGSFSLDSRAVDPLVSATITDFGVKTFPGKDLTVAPVHYFYGENLGVNLSEIKSVPATATQAEMLRTVFDGAADTVYTAANFQIPEGFEKVVITGLANVQVKANGLDNTITGNSGSNVIDGGDGLDTFSTSGTLASTTGTLNSDGSVTLVYANGEQDIFKPHLERVLQEALPNGNAYIGTATGGAGDDFINYINTSTGMPMGTIPTVSGGAGDDFLVWSGGYPTTMDGGDGFDTLILNNMFNMVNMVYKTSPTGTGYSGQVEYQSTDGWKSFRFDNVEAIMTSSDQYGKISWFESSYGMETYQGTFSQTDYQSFLKTGFAFDGYAANTKVGLIAQGSSIEKIQFSGATAVDTALAIDGAAVTYNFQVGVGGAKAFTSFATGDGTYGLDSSGSNAYPAMLQLSSGKLLIATQHASNLEIARLNADGTPDTTFASGGQYKITMPIMANELQNIHLAESSSGEVFMYGARWGSESRVYAVNTASASLTDMGVNGATNSNGVVGMYVVNNQIVLVGSNWHSDPNVGAQSSNDVYLLKGQLSSGAGPMSTTNVTWGSPQYVLTPTVYEKAVVSAIDTAHQSIYVYSSNNSTLNWSDPVASTVTKFNLSGTVDTTFGLNGTLQTGHRYTDAYSDPLGIDVDGNGNFVLAYFSGTDRTTIQVERYTQQGVLDRTFGGGDGIATIALDSVSNSAWSGWQQPRNLLQIDANNQPVLVFESQGAPRIIRLESNGTVINNLYDTSATENNAIFDSAQSTYSSPVSGNPYAFDIGADGSIYISEQTWLNNSDFSIVKVTNGAVDKSFDEPHQVSYTLSMFDGSSLPTWLSLDTSSTPKVVVTNATTNADWGHHYVVLTASGSSADSKVFDIYIKPNDLGTNDTLMFDKNAATGVVNPLDVTGNASPLGFDTLDLSNATTGLVGAFVQVFATGSTPGSTVGDIYYYPTSSTGGENPVNYQFDGFDKYVLAAADGYFEGTSTASEYVVIKAGSGYDIYLGSNTAGAVETDVISFEASTSKVNISLSASDNPNAVVTATLAGTATVTHKVYGAEGVVGSDSTTGDTITGNYRNNILAGGAGNDTLSGGLGHDLLIGGTGTADTLLGGDGRDVLMDFDGAILKGDDVQLTANNLNSAQRDVFVVRDASTIQNFQLSANGTGLAGRSTSANDSIVFNLNLATVASQATMANWSWVKSSSYLTGTTAQKEAFNTELSKHLKVEVTETADTTTPSLTDVKLSLYAYENANYSGTKVLMGSTTVDNVSKAVGDQLVVVALPQLNLFNMLSPDMDLGIADQLAGDVANKAVSINVAMALESVREGTIRQTPGQEMMTGKWTATERYYNPAEGNQKIISSDGKDTVELLLQDLADKDATGKGLAGHDKMNDIGGVDTLSFSDAHINDLHFQAIKLGREVGNQSLQVSYEQSDGQLVNTGNMTWTGHFRDGVSMALEQVMVKDVNAQGAQGAIYKTYQVAETVYNWSKGVLQGVDYVAHNGSNAIMVGQNDASSGVSDRFVIEKGFTANTIVETQDVYLWGFDLNAPLDSSHQLDQLVLRGFGALSSDNVHVDAENLMAVFDVANTTGQADHLRIHFMDTTISDLNTLHTTYVA